MRFSARLTLVPLLLCGAAVCAAAQTTVQPSGTGAITGRITVGEKPARGVGVVLLPANSHGPERKAVARATSDAEGQFRLSNLPAGHYEVMPVAPTYVMPGGAPSMRNRSKAVNLNEGETVEGIDFTLARGGVITGRVTDADGRPVIGEHLRLTLAGAGNERRGQFFFNAGYGFDTDDRGIYRIYGLPAGRYLLSVGEDGRSGTVRMGYGRGGYYPKTFHPGVTDEARATVVEVSEGSETTNVDITLGRRAETFSASGQVVDAETGQPLANITAGYGALRAGENRMGALGFGGRTDAAGRFRLDGLLPGNYGAFAAFDAQDNRYSVPVTFEINEADVTGLLIRVRRGSSLSGMAVIEGASDRATLAKLSQLRVQYWPEHQSLVAPTLNGDGVRINPDGSFQISGLRPGKVRLMLGVWPPQKGFVLIRVERDGLEQRAGIVDVPAGSQVTGVRFVLEYGTGVIRGQVRVENGQLPEGTRFYVSARRPNGTEPSLPGAEVDARGHFIMDGLPPGEYQLRLAGRAFPSGPRIPIVVKNVQVTNGVETPVTLVVDLNAKGEPDK